MNPIRKLIVLLVLLCLAPIARSADPEPAPVQIAPARVPGNWMALHPEWRGNIVFYPDGTFVRPHIGGGRWLVTNDEEKSLVVLRWNSWGTETLTVISPDHLRGPQKRGTFRLYRIPPAPPDVLPANRDLAEVEATAARLNDSKWELIDHKRFKLHADGSVSSEFDDRKGIWEVVAPNALKIRVPWLPAPTAIVTTNDDGTILRWTDDETNLAVREGA
jgi:hypothetical protein